MCDSSLESSSQALHILTQKSLINVTKSTVYFFKASLIEVKKTRLHLDLINYLATNLLHPC